MGNELFMLLKQDHTEARRLMEEILSASPDRRQGLFIDLEDAVKLHMQLEETYFYPKLEGHKVLKPAQQDAVREHREARELFQRLNRMEATGKEWEDTFRLLEQGLLKHMQIEEGYVFEKCLDIFTDLQMREIAQQCREEKQRAQRQIPGQGEQAHL